jgi:hypothetical protein
MPRIPLTIGLAAGVLLLLLVAAAPAFAVDGVRVLPDSQDGGNRWQFGADVSDHFVAYVQGINPFSDEAVIALKSLDNDHTPITFGSDLTAGFKNLQPRILSYDGKIYVVWSQISLASGDTDIWIWQGTYDTGTQWFTADDGFPKPLSTGTITTDDGTTASQQWSPAIGLVHEVDDSDHIVVAWEDTRDNGYAAPVIYYGDLSADQSYTDPSWVDNGGPASFGVAFDQTDVLARGQHAPDVGSTGVYWLDDRWSFWDSGNLTDTAIWRARPTFEGLVPGPCFTDFNHTYDNGMSSGVGGGPRVTGSGAVWLRSGPYGDQYAFEPMMKSGGSLAKTVSPMTNPVSPDAWYTPGQTATGMTLAGAHLDRKDAIDLDVFFFDPVTQQRMPVCDLGNPAGATMDDHPDYWRKLQSEPAIGPSLGGYRVVWTDNRDAALTGAEDNADSRLYEAFVPTVTIKAARTLKGATISTKVSPNFAGKRVRLELVKASTKYGATLYTVLHSKLSTEKTLSSQSGAGWTFKSLLKGTYLVRIRFLGGTKYAYDGSTVATPDMVAVPHIPNVSKVMKIVVK